MWTLFSLVIDLDLMIFIPVYITMTIDVALIFSSFNKRMPCNKMFDNMEGIVKKFLTKSTHIVVAEDKPQTSLS
jgi:hypothetical protein